MLAQSDKHGTERFEHLIRTMPPCCEPLIRPPRIERLTKARQKLGELLLNTG
jgi:hypothetical protein